LFLQQLNAVSHSLKHFAQRKGTVRGNRAQNVKQASFDIEARVYQSRPSKVVGWSTKGEKLTVNAPLLSRTTLEVEVYQFRRLRHPVGLSFLEACAMAQ
jgi:hypothetical protein